MTETLIVIAIVILLFVVLRSFTLWYFKINTIIDLLTEMVELQRKSLNQTQKSDEN